MTTQSDKTLDTIWFTRCAGNGRGGVPTATGLAYQHTFGRLPLRNRFERGNNFGHLLSNDTQAMVEMRPGGIGGETDIGY